jgi:hypothetical protein
MKATYLLLPLLAMSACTDDDAFTAQASTVEGIYRVDSHLINQGACTAGGDPVADSQTFAYAKRIDILGTKALQIYSCSSLDDCRAKASQPAMAGPISFAFTLTGIDGDALTGFEVTSGFSGEGDTCLMPELENFKLVLNGDALKLEARVQVGADYTADSNGYCTTDKGRASAEAAPCSVFETLAATKLEAL